MMDADSYLTVDCYVARDHCNNTINRIMEARKKRDDAYVNRFQKSSNKRRKLWNKICLFKCFKKQLISFQDAESILKDLSKDNLYYWSRFPSEYAWGTLKVATTVLQAAQAACRGEAKREMMISVEDWDAIVN